MKAFWVKKLRFFFGSVYNKYIDIFAENVSYSHFCKTINLFENTLATIVKEFVINELVKLTMLWRTGPCM